MSNYSPLPIIVAAVLVFAGCKSSPPEPLATEASAPKPVVADPAVPRWIEDPYGTHPELKETHFLASGSGQSTVPELARRKAKHRAMAQLAAQIRTDIEREETRTEVDGQTTHSVDVHSKVNEALTGCQVLEDWRAPDGSFHMLVALERKAVEDAQQHQRMREIIDKRFREERQKTDEDRQRESEAFHREFDRRFKDLNEQPSGETAQDPHDAAGFTNRGFARRSKGDLDGAIADYSKALELDPSYMIAFYQRGLARKAKRDLDGAIADHSRALELDPRYALAFYGRGTARCAKGDQVGAIADWKKALELAPPDWPVRKEIEVLIRVEEERKKD